MKVGGCDSSKAVPKNPGNLWTQVEPNALEGVRLVTMQSEQGLPCCICYFEASLSDENETDAHIA